MLRMQANTLINLQRRTIQHCCTMTHFALPKPWSHTNTFHIPQHRHLHTDAHGRIRHTYCKQKHFSARYENTASINIHQHLNSELGTAFGGHFYDGCLLCFSQSVFWMWEAGNSKSISNHDADNTFDSMAHPSMNYWSRNMWSAQGAMTSWQTISRLVGDSNVH